MAGNGRYEQVGAEHEAVFHLPACCISGEIHEERAHDGQPVLTGKVHVMQNIRFEALAQAKKVAENGVSRFAE